jgi:hypothetical protein
MKLLTSAFVVIFLSGCHYAQQQSESKCRLQDLAIDAALGDSEAQHNLGVEFHRGVNLPQDFSKAAVMWRLASSVGVIESSNNLGYLTYYGKGVKQDHAEGVRLWRIAAEKGFAESQVHLGDAYSDGEYLQRDYVEAYAWARTGRHYAERMDDAALGKSIAQMADNLLADVEKRLSKAQLTEAENKAAEYISKYRSN